MGLKLIKMTIYSYFFYFIEEIMKIDITLEIYTFLFESIYILEK